MQPQEQDIIHPETHTRIGKLKIQAAGVDIVPVGQIKYRIEMFDKDGKQLGTIEHRRPATYITWDNMRPFMYQESDLPQKLAVALAREIMIKHAKIPHILDIVNDFTREHLQESGPAL